MDIENPREQRPSGEASCLNCGCVCLGISVPDGAFEVAFSDIHQAYDRPQVCFQGEVGERRQSVRRELQTRSYYLNTFRSHVIIVVSCDPEASVFPSGLNVNAVIGPV
jgi:hypothetical protein